MLWDLKPRWYTATLQPLSATSSKSQTTTKQKMELQNCQNCTFEFSSLKKVSRKSVKEVSSPWMVLQIHWNDSKISPMFWMTKASDFFTWVKSMMDQKEGWKINGKSQGCWNTYSIYIYCIIYIYIHYFWLRCPRSFSGSLMRDQTVEPAFWQLHSVFQGNWILHLHVPATYCHMTWAFLDDRDSDIGGYISILKLKTCAQ